jgi:hypothetical protein
MVFGTAQDVSGLPNSAAEDKYIKYLQGAFAAFAQDSESGLTEYGWPEYDVKGMQDIAQLLELLADL